MERFGSGVPGGHVRPALVTAQFDAQVTPAAVTTHPGLPGQISPALVRKQPGLVVPEDGAPPPGRVVLAGGGVVVVEDVVVVEVAVVVVEVAVVVVEDSVVVVGAVVVVAEVVVVLAEAAVVLPVEVVPVLGEGAPLDGGLVPFFQSGCRVSGDGWSTFVDAEVVVPLPSCRLSPRCSASATGVAKARTKATTAPTTPCRWLIAASLWSGPWREPAGRRSG
jgi:hypothetical protein